MELWLTDEPRMEGTVSPPPRRQPGLSGVAAVNTFCRRNRHCGWSHWNVTARGGGDSSRETPARAACSSPGGLCPVPESSTRRAPEPPLS